MTTTIRANVRDGGANMNPDHPAFGRTTYYAEPDPASSQVLLDAGMGAPLGRGGSPEAALSDLRERVGSDFVVADTANPPAATPGAKVEIQWMSYDNAKSFREVGRTRAASLTDAMELIRSVYPDAKIAADDDPAGAWRVTAKSQGGRSGRNVAFIEDFYEDEG